MKFIHCSDIHLGRRPVGGVGLYSEKRFHDYFIAFRQVIERAVQENVDALLIAGDLFDKRELSPEILHRTENELEILRDQGIAVVAIEGNHDNITPGKEHESWIIYLEKKGLLSRPYYKANRSDEKDEIEYDFSPVIVQSQEIYGLGYPGGMIVDVVTAFRKYLDDTDKTDVIALLHTAPAGGDFLPGLITQEDVSQLQERVSYLACGHFHSHSVYPTENPFLFIPGSTEYWDLGEKSGGKGMILFDTESKKYDFLTTEPRTKTVIQIETTSDKTIYEEFESKYREITVVEKEDIVIVEVTDSSGEAIDTAILQKIANDITEPLRLEVVVKRQKKGDGTSRRRREGESVKMVEDRIMQDWDLFGDHHSKVQTTLVHLKENLKTNNEELFRNSFDTLLDHMIEDES